MEQILQFEEAKIAPKRMPKAFYERMMKYQQARLTPEQLQAKQEERERQGEERASQNIMDKMTKGQRLGSARATVAYERATNIKTARINQINHRHETKFAFADAKQQEIKNNKIDTAKRMAQGGTILVQ